MMRETQSPPNYLFILVPTSIGSLLFYVFQEGRKEASGRKRKAGRRGGSEGKEEGRNLRTQENNQKSVVIYRLFRKQLIVICDEQAGGNNRVNCISTGRKTLESKEKIVRSSEAQCICSVLYSWCVRELCVVCEEKTNIINNFGLSKQTAGQNCSLLKWKKSRYFMRKQVSKPTSWLVSCILYQKC